MTLEGIDPDTLVVLSIPYRGTPRGTSVTVGPQLDCVRGCPNQILRFALPPRSESVSITGLRSGPAPNALCARRRPSSLPFLCRSMCKTSSAMTGTSSTWDFLRSFVLADLGSFAAASSLGSRSPPTDSSISGWHRHLCQAQSRPCRSSPVAMTRVQSSSVPRPSCCSLRRELTSSFLLRFRTLRHIVLLLACSG